DFGQYPLPRFELPKLVVWLFGPLLGPVTRPFISRNVGYDISFNNQRSLNLGLHYRTAKTTIVEHFQQLIDDGLIRKRG
ncbi:MAG: diaminohydroxyphosphoribosylaminopyrimidine deaminase, partial [Moraxellaceae bacterium]|nr:diaminohydroxyphosphoribosylaminopyrimidine deaminase [Moraxellaceae bacterium]